MREINQQGLNLIKSFEGLKLKSYICPAGKLTIGYGHTGPDVKFDMTINQVEATNLLKQDLEKFCKGVDLLVKVPVNDNQFAALVAFSFNVGLSSLRMSSLLTMLNLGMYKDAADEFLKWDKINVNGIKQVSKGLVKRRQEERKLFLTKK